MTKRVWVPNVVTEQVPYTVNKAVWEDVPYEYTVTVNRPETRTRTVPVTRMRTEQRTRMVTVNRCRQEERSREVPVTTYKTEQRTRTVPVTTMTTEPWRPASSNDG